jgi:GT2 family glycosyltransferase
MLKENSLYNQLTLVIVSYKSKDIILNNLNVIKNFRTIIVDNSNDLDFKKNLSQYKNINYVALSKNIGFGKANNLGVSYAATEYVLILNPDIKVDYVSILKLFNTFFKYKNVGVVGPTLLDEFGKKRTNSSLSFLKKIISRSTFEKNIFKVNEKKESCGDLCADYIIGCAMLFNKNFFLSIGGFNHIFFLFFEDNEICDRIKNYGFQVIESFDSEMIHYQGKSSKYSFIDVCRSKIIHKYSEYTYLSLNKKNLTFYLFFDFLDFFQRFLFNFLRFKFKNSFTNLLRIVSIFLFTLSKLKY